MGYKIEVKEERRTIVFKGGQRLELHNVTGFDCSTAWLRIWCDEGYLILNESAILYHTIKGDVVR